MSEVNSNRPTDMDAGAWRLPPELVNAIVKQSAEDQQGLLIFAVIIKVYKDRTGRTRENATLVPTGAALKGMLHLRRLMQTCRHVREEVRRNFKDVLPTGLGPFLYNKSKDIICLGDTHHLWTRKNYIVDQLPAPSTFDIQLLGLSIKNPDCYRKEPTGIYQVMFMSHFPHLRQIYGVLPLTEPNRAHHGASLQLGAQPRTTFDYSLRYNLNMNIRAIASAILMMSAHNNHPAPPIQAIALAPQEFPCPIGPKEAQASTGRSPTRIKETT